MRSLQEIRADWQEALKEHQEAMIQYEPFIAKGTLTPGINPVPIDFDDLRAAHDRLEKANKWLNKIIAEFHEATSAGQK